jgi:uncharacterized protein CbrC (UPF0167 family)
VREHVAEYIEKNKPDRAPEFSDLDYSGEIHAMVDCAVPLYEGEIRDIWSVHADELLSAYQGDAGIGDVTNPTQQLAAIYCWLELKVADALADGLVEEVYNAWLEANGDA